MGRTIERWNEGTMERWNDRTIVLRLRQGYGGQRMSMPVRREELEAKRNPGYMYIQRNRRNYRFLLVAVSFHPAYLAKIIREQKAENEGYCAPLPHHLFSTSLDHFINYLSEIRVYYPVKLL